MLFSAVTTFSLLTGCAIDVNQEIADSSEGKVASSYIKAAQAQKKVEEFYGMCSSDTDRAQAEEVLKGITEYRELEFDGSSSSAETASINVVMISHQGEQNIALHLRKENNEWKVCSTHFGHTIIDIGPEDDGLY
ncbi:hypothetical protein GTY86_05330 [Streptomyces sp. SID5770]|uniref:hypothetical protein n=1 Tax=Streptomyces sp. SID5770 TaxID=2690308 RepID=UPI00136A59FC|nr:hypothetical protein [Streptomyces sp. SID5770]MZE50749.1 hypothetical protein [Streptomyces sp. SID5770]